ncbi:MAG: exodeoxyribonuclease VII small subunit [Acidimicrobiaceae bacterium]|nr:exodeoxyribonuclease VII small subunit [Acidimicrobiaceae bacterium]
MVDHPPPRRLPGPVGRRRGGRHDACHDTGRRNGDEYRRPDERRIQRRGESPVTQEDDATEPGLTSYAEALDEVQEILAALESDATDIDLLAERVQRADLLIRHCRSRLDDARLRVEQVVAGSKPQSSDEQPGD